MDTKNKVIRKSGNYASRYLDLYMDKCHKNLDNGLAPIQCLWIMIDRVIREMPYTHRNMKTAKKDTLHYINAIFNELDTKKVH